MYKASVRVELRLQFDFRLFTPKALQSKAYRAAHAG